MLAVFAPNMGAATVKFAIKSYALLFSVYSVCSVVIKSFSA